MCLYVSVMCLYVSVMCLYMYQWCAYVNQWCAYMCQWCAYMCQWCAYMCQWCAYMCTVQITFIFIDFRVCDFAFAVKKTHPAFRVLNVFYYHTDFNLRFIRKRDVRLTCRRVWCILRRALSIKWICPVTSHIIAQMDLTSGFGNISELN